MCSSARATVSRASRWSVVSRTTPSIRAAWPSAPATTRPRASTQRTDSVRQRHPVLRRVVAARLQRRGHQRLDRRRCPRGSSAAQNVATRWSKVVGVDAEEPAGPVVEVEVVGPDVPVEPADPGGRHHQVAVRTPRWSSSRGSSPVVIAGETTYAVGHRHPPPRSRSRVKSATLAAMSIDPRAGQPASDADLVDVPALVTAYYTGHPDVGEPAQQVAFGTSGHRGSSLDLAFNEDHIAATTPGDLRAPGGGRDRRPAVPRPGHPRAVRAGLGDRARGARRQRRHRAGRRPRPLHADAGCLARDPPAQPRTHDRRRSAPTASSSRRRTTRRATAASSTTRPTAAPPAATSPAGSRTAPTRSCATASRDVRRVPLARARAADTTSTYDYLGTYVDDLPAGARPRRDPRGGRADRRRPAGRRERRLLGRDRRAAPARPHRGQPAGRPDLAVHDAGLGRQDPDGLLVAVRDGVAGAGDGSRCAVRHRHRQRRRRRPARHRHPRRRPAQPEPLPRRRDRLPVLAPRGLVARRRRRQDAGELEHDRPGRREPRPAAGRGAGRLQVVRARPARRLGRLRRRGVGGRVVPAPGRRGLDDRQGRHPARRCWPRRSSPSPGRRRASGTAR